MMTDSLEHDYGVIFPGIKLEDLKSTPKTSALVSWNCAFQARWPTHTGHGSRPHLPATSGPTGQILRRALGSTNIWPCLLLSLQGTGRCVWITAGDVTQVSVPGQGPLATPALSSTKQQQAEEASGWRNTAHWLLTQKQLCGWQVTGNRATSSLSKSTLFSLPRKIIDASNIK